MPNDSSNTSNKLPETSLSEEENEAKWDLLQVKLQERKAASAFESFRSAGFEPILIKGFAAAQYYPSDVGRTSVDIDLCFSPEDHDEARRHNLTNPISGVAVDFHKGFRHLDSLSWEELFSRSILIEAEGTEIRVLCAEDNLRVLCVHWLTDGGENKKRLSDIKYAVENRPENFSWEKCLDVVPENRRNWVIYTIGLAHYYLDLDIDDLPFKSKALSVPKWVRAEIEKHWELNVPITPLNSTLGDGRAFWKQIRKRLPPNPIHATVVMDGDLDARTRIFYQVGNFFQRLAPSWRGLIRSATSRFRRRK